MSEQLQAAVLEVLLDHQRHHGWADREMATRLGISRSYWSLIRTHARPLTFPVVMRALKAFPEHRALILSLLVAYAQEEQEPAHVAV